MVWADSRRKSPWWGFSLLSWVAIQSCAPVGEPESFQLDRFLQSGKEDVYLNERLVFKFNAWVDPFSISRESLSIVSDDGAPARGSYRVNAREIEFRPDPVLDPSLADGGFKPGAFYEVRVAGFPYVRGLRSLDGRILPQSRRFRFRVIHPQHLPPGVRTPFFDENPGDLFALRKFSQEPVLGDLLQVEFSKPIRPDTVTSSSFRLYEGNVPNRGEEIPLTVGLASDREQRVVELKPDWSRIRTEAIYRIEIDASKISDFNANPLFRDAFADRRPALSFRFLR